MLYRVTADRARTVDFLAVFAEGEVRDFTETEANSFSALYGVPLASALPTGFQVEFIGDETPARKTEEN